MFTALKKFLVRKIYKIDEKFKDCPHCYGSIAHCNSFRIKLSPNGTPSVRIDETFNKCPKTSRKAREVVEKMNKKLDSKD